MLGFESGINSDAKRLRRGFSIARAADRRNDGYAVDARRKNVGDVSELDAADGNTGQSRFAGDFGNALRT